MYVKAIIILSSVIIILVLYLLFRSRTNKSRVSKNRDSVDELKAGNRESKTINNELERNSRDRRTITGKIEQNNINAGSGINEAIKILKTAKIRSNTKQDI